MTIYPTHLEWNLEIVFRPIDLILVRSSADDYMYVPQHNICVIDALLITIPVDVSERTPESLHSIWASQFWCSVSFPFAVTFHRSCQVHHDSTLLQQSAQKTSFSSLKQASLFKLCWRALTATFTSKGHSWNDVLVQDRFILNTSI